MFQLMLARWLAVSTGLLALTAAAQTAHPAPAASRTAPAASAAAAQMQAAPGEYRSAFEGYQPYSETKMVPWTAANDTVGQIGGWRAYAKEAAEGQGQGHAGHAAPAASAPKPAPSQAKP